MSNYERKEVITMMDMINKFCETRTAEKTKIKYKVFLTRYYERFGQFEQREFRVFSSEKEGSANSENNHIAIIKAFFSGIKSEHEEFYNDNELYKFMRITKRKDLNIKTHLPLDIEEFGTLAKYCVKNPSTFTKTAGILMHTGIRYNEISDVIKYLNEFNKSDCGIHVYESKNHRTRNVYLPKMPGPLMNFKMEDPVEHRRFNYWFKQSFEFKVSHSAHSLRSSYATFLHAFGMPIDEIAVAMGKVDKHGVPCSSLYTYLRSSSERIKDRISGIFSESTKGIKSRQDLQDELLRVNLEVMSLRKQLQVKEDKVNILSPHAQKIHNLIARRIDV